MEGVTLYRNELAGLPFSGLMNDFISYIDRGARTTRNALNNLKQFAAWMKFRAITAPQRQDIISFRDWLLSEHEAVALDPGTASGWSFRRTASGAVRMVSCRPSTCRAYLQTVKQFFSWTASNGYYPNVAANVHAPRIGTGHKKDSLTASEVVTVEASIRARTVEHEAAASDARKDTAGRIQRATEQGKRLYAMYLLAVNAGLRTVELSRANIKDLETKNGLTYLYIHGKGRAEADQKKPLAPEVAEALRDYLDSRTDFRTGSSPLFVATGNRSGGRRIAETTISTMLKRALQAAGFDSERITAHSLRHTVGDGIMQITGKNIYKTQLYMRHSSPATTEIYLDNDKAAQDAETARRLYAYYHGTADASGLDKLHGILARMNAEQIETLCGIAAAIA